MISLVYYIKNMSGEIQVFEPFSILGLEPGASDSEIKKAYRRLSIHYHPDENPDPEAHKYSVEFISKAYQALTDPISRENFEKCGHPDGKQVFQMGIALPQFLLDIDVLMEGSFYCGLWVSVFFCLCKVMEVFIKAAEYMEIPVRKIDDEPLQKLFLFVRSELNLNLKNIKQEQAKFWKQHPTFVKTEMLIQVQLTRESATLSPAFAGDFKRVLELAPRLLEELMKAVPLAVQGKQAGGSSEGTAPVLQLPHFSDAVIKKIAREKVKTFQEFRDISREDSAEILGQVAGFSAGEAEDVERFLEMMSSLSTEVTCETEDEESIQEGDVVTIQVWVTLTRANGLVGSLPHAPHYPFPKEENYWLLLADQASNNV